MLNVLCLKHGTKYGPEYVNNLYNMVQRHLTVPHRFICFTENHSQLNPKIEIRPLTNARLAGWWWKPYLFKKGHFNEGDINLFFDLDMVIIKNIDNLVTYMPTQLVGLRDLGRVFNTNYTRLGSAILRWPANQYSDIWDKLETSPELTTKFRGDQDYLWNFWQDHFKFFPDKWIMSYKWEIRNKSELVRTSNNRFNFNSIRTVSTDPETSVLAFHGSPDPHEVKDSIIVDNWC